MEKTIIPKRIDEPKPGKRCYTVTDAEGAKFLVYPDKTPMSVYVIDKPIKVVYEPSEFKGKVYNHVNSIVVHEETLTPPQTQNATRTQQNGPKTPELVEAIKVLAAIVARLTLAIEGKNQKTEASISGGGSRQPGEDDLPF